MRIFGVAVAVVILALSCHAIDSEESADRDDFYDSRERILEENYHGLIKENETFVEITPVIKVDEEKVCRLDIVKKQKDIPFKIKLDSGVGILESKRALNCEKRKNYKFEIVAVMCDGSHSENANVHISVVDINEYSPTFLQPSYVTEVDEGRLYQEILRVEATDKDCTPLFGDVCKYEILTLDQPFTIDNEGSIRNTEPLSHKISHNHILSVVAYDCAMKQSAPVMVNIRVRRICEPKISGIPERLDYTSNSMEKVFLFPKLHLELCDMKCKGEDMLISSTVSLKTKHMAFGCDRDLSKCAAKNSMQELLRKGSDFTKELITDDGVENIFHFDGTNGAVVPKSVVDVDGLSAHPFTISTMFRHHSIVNNDKLTKEHVICSADSHKMNRHHFALFVRHCRLILLLRKNYNDGDLNIFLPAEWRWKIPQVCDNEWHHYTITVESPKVELFIDGIKFEADQEDKHSNPEVIDDWPLHAAQGINTTLTIGACYQSSENRLKHGFRGDISSIKLISRQALSEEDIRCGMNCAERLLSPDEKLMEPEQQVQMNSEMNEVVIEGSNRQNVEKLLQKIQYINDKENPTLGRRNIQVSTTVSCPMKKAVRLPSIDSFIMIVDGEKHQNVTDHETPTITTDYQEINPQLTEEQRPQIVISGNQNNLVSYPDIKSGVKFLDSLNIVVYTNDQILENLQKLDSCSVNVFPNLNADHEEITMSKQNHDHDLSPILDIKTTINKDGVEMIGYDTVTNYLRILRSLIYINRKPAYYLNRVFKLSCSQLGDRFRSAEFTLTLTVLHPKQPTLAPLPVVTEKPAVAAREHDSSNMFAHVLLHPQEANEPHAKTSHMQRVSSVQHSTMLIIVICVSFVLLICGVGIARLRNQTQVTKSKKGHQSCAKNPSEQQLDWDDSALTITINPMQNDNLTDDSSDSENSDSDDEEVLNGRYKNVSQLEWDNTTM
ncbi:hypothetical protein ACKWTF_014360 [Chironomus riparius]